MNKEIIPACMPDRFDDIRETALSVRSNVSTIQLDIMDGVYVPETTWPYKYTQDYKLEELKKEDSGFPLWEELNYELDLMVQKPEENLDTWLSIGASRVIFHYASVADWSLIKNLDRGIRSFVQIGIAVTIHDDIQEIFHLIDSGCIDFVQVMGIENIGYMGEPFTEDALWIIAEIQKKYPELILSIDGGVSEQTIPVLKKIGISRFVSGSGVFGHGIPSENVTYLNELLK